MGRAAFGVAIATAAMATLLSVGAHAGPDDIPLRIEDASGKVLGRAWWLGDRWNAVMQGATQVFAVGLTSFDSDMTRLDLDHRGSIYYTTADCTGQAYLLPWMGYGTVRAAIAVHADGRHQLLVASGTAQYIVVNSEQAAPRKCRSHATQLSVAPVVETIDITEQYQPPFWVR